NDPHRTFDATAFEPDPNKIHHPRGMPDTKALRKDLASYLGEIQRLDHNVGELLKELEKRGLTKNTLVVFMGDNGGALLRGKGTLYDLGLHVPLIARWPNKIKANQKTDVLISGEDIAPTFLAIANARIPKEVTGKSFVATFSNPSYSPRDLVFAVRGAHASALPNGTASFDLGRAVFDKRYKLVYNALWQLPYQPVDFGNQPFWIELKKQHQEGTLAPEYAALFFAAQRPMFEVFDLQEDPYELKNLAGEANISQVERKLKADLQEWMILNQDYLPLPLRQGNK
ncbi:MAG: sulfatase/phosphatase domain-containing protein, partial [Pedobacter agri]